MLDTLMHKLSVAGRLLRLLAAEPRVRRAAVRGGAAILALGMAIRLCGGGSSAAPSEVGAKVPAFCKRFDPSEIYLWGEVRKGSDVTRAISTLSDPASYCELPARATFLPSVREDRRLMYVRDHGSSGERAYFYEPGGGPPPELPTPNCVTRFSWLAYGARHMHYGCEVRDPYEKAWIPAFYRNAGELIGSGRGLSKAFGEPSDGRVFADTRDGLAVLDMGTNEVFPVSGLPSAPRLVRATRWGFLAMTDSSDGDDARLWRIDRSGAVALEGKLAALPERAVHSALGMTSDGDVYEYLPALPDAADGTNTIVVRTRARTRTVYSDGEWKKRGKPFVRLDTKSPWGAGIVSGR
ncbi:hypothetical protein BH11MYX4_BH11MYX4_15720 [soil metagenome]